MNEQQEKVYQALSKAAQRMGKRNYDEQGAQHIKAKRSKKSFQFVVTEAHRKVIDTMIALEAGKITADAAMAVLHEYDVSKERLGTAL